MTDPLTLTVVLRPAGGGDPPPEGATAQNIAGQLPDPQAASRVQEFFADRGFTLGALVGIGFSITGSADLSREVFGTVPEVGELALDGLPAQISEHVVAVEAEPPLDFGPGSF